MNRAEILDTAKDYITRDRQATHGKPEATFGMICRFWSDYLGIPITNHDVCQMMVLFKIARSKANPEHADNYVDAAGYSALAGELATGRIKNPHGSNNG